MLHRCGANCDLTNNLRCYSAMLVTVLCARSEEPKSRSLSRVTSLIHVLRLVALSKMSWTNLWLQPPLRQKSAHGTPVKEGALSPRAYGHGQVYSQLSPHFINVIHPVIETQRWVFAKHSHID